MGIELYGVEALDLCSNSKYLKKNNIFYIMGEFDFPRFLPQVLAQNPLKIVLEKKHQDLVNYQYLVIVEDVRKTYRCDVEKFYSSLLSHFTHIGITGTKGKSTIAYSLFRALQSLSQDVSYLGTMGFYYRDFHVPMLNTTPGLNDFIEILKDLKSKKISILISEVSSQGLMQERVPVQFYQHRVFTDLSPEHLDCHLTMENYFQEKLKFFQEGKHYKAYVLDRSSYGERVLSNIEAEAYLYGLQRNSTFEHVELKDDLNGLRLECEREGQNYTFETHLTGFFNGENISCIISILINLGFEIAKIQKAIQEIPFIPGRMEKVSSFNGAFIYVDFAHSSESLDFVLSSVSQKVSGKLFVVFGCGGDRDPLKRPLMAKSAQKYADVIIVSNDNPRFEDPSKIVADIVKGFTKKASYQVILDRKSAIESAMKELDQGDVLLLCGKGHEDYQIIGNKKEYFCDKEVVLEYAKSCS